MTKMLTMQQVTDNLQVCERTIKKQILKGELEAVKIGAVYRFFEEDIEAYLKKRKLSYSKKKKVTLI